jgi:hypothetical protein
MSSRQQIGYVYTNWLLGLTRFLRQNGTSPLALLCYKLVMSLDAPLQWLSHACQYLWRLGQGQQVRAARSLMGVRRVNYFLCRGLIPFWLA